MTPLDFHCSEVSHARHLLPVWQALPPEARGTFTAGIAAAGWLSARGVDVEVARIPADSTRPTVVASFPDLRDCRGRPLALVEHGAGQTYIGLTSGGYPGGPDRDPVSLFLCPSPRVAYLNSARYPDAEVRVVGCSTLDGRWNTRTPNRPPTVALSFHWAADFTVPEGRPAWPAYVKHLRAIRDGLEGRVIGHGHPRALDRYRARYEQAGIEVVDDFDEVLDRADVYAVDISSTGFEAAATGLAVVWLDAPWYDRQAGHGLRWGWQAEAVGWRCLGPESLPVVAGHAAAVPDTIPGRLAGLEDVYAWAGDNMAAARSAEALLDWAPYALPWSDRPYRPGRAR